MEADRGISTEQTGFFYSPSVSFYRELLQYSCAALQTQAAAAVDFGRK